MARRLITEKTTRKEAIELFRKEHRAVKFLKNRIKIYKWGFKQEAIRRKAEAKRYQQICKRFAKMEIAYNYMFIYHFIYRYCRKHKLKITPMNLYFLVILYQYKDQELKVHEIVKRHPELAGDKVAFYRSIYELVNNGLVIKHKYQDTREVVVSINKLGESLVRNFDQKVREFHRTHETEAET